MTTTMPSMFRRSIAVFRAAVDEADMMPQRYDYAWHHNEITDSVIKMERGVKYTDSPKIRGAIAWAMRAPGRQVTVLKSGEIQFN